MAREDLSAVEVNSQRQPERRCVEVRQAATDVKEIHPYLVATRSLSERLTIEFDRRTHRKIRIRRSSGDRSPRSRLGDRFGGAPAVERRCQNLEVRARRVELQLPYNAQLHHRWAVAGETPARERLDDLPQSRKLAEHSAASRRCQSDHLIEVSVGQTKRVGVLLVGVVAPSPTETEPKAHRRLGCRSIPKPTFLLLCGRHDGHHGPSVDRGRSGELQRFPRPCRSDRRQVCKPVPRAVELGHLQTQVVVDEKQQAGTGALALPSQPQQQLVEPLPSELDLQSRRALCKLRRILLSPSQLFEVVGTQGGDLVSLDVRAQQHAAEGRHRFFHRGLGRQ